MKKKLTQFIKQKCLEEGFIKAGISKADKLNEEGKYLIQWLNEKKNADMHWMNNTLEKRINPELVMEDVKSILSIAYLYDTPFSHNDDAKIPKISRYAWGKKIIIKL